MKNDISVTTLIDGVSDMLVVTCIQKSSLSNMRQRSSSQPLDRRLQITREEGERRRKSGKTKKSAHTKGSDKSAR